MILFLKWLWWAQKQNYPPWYYFGLRKRYIAFKRDLKTWNYYKKKYSDDYWQLKFHVPDWYL